MLTARDHINDRVRGLREGADDYLTKPFSFLELVERLHALARRTRAQESTLISVGDLYVDLIGRRATRDGMRLDLTAKEFQLLSVLARRHGDILSKTAITELVWEVDFESHTNVVETAIKRLRAKLDGPFRTKLLHTVRGMGYVLEVREAREMRKTRGHHETLDLPPPRRDVRAGRAVRVHAGGHRALSRAAHAARTSPARIARHARRDRAAHRPARGHAGQMEDGEGETRRHHAARPLARSSPHRARIRATRMARRSPARIEKRLPGGYVRAAPRTDAPTTCSRPRRPIPAYGDASAGAIFRSRSTARRTCARCACSASRSPP